MVDEAGNAMSAKEAIAFARAEIARVRAKQAAQRRPDPSPQSAPRSRPAADEVVFLRDELSLLIRQMAALAEHARHLQERLDALTAPTRGPSEQPAATEGDGTTTRADTDANQVSPSTTEDPATHA